ncbi:hypothetical protein BDR05DRAFT_996016 [Suillus weaverae]|nr:hypothetical protein BDR05DRAFT_996016 [Suillus weaverae]
MSLLKASALVSPSTAPSPARFHAPFPVPFPAPSPMPSPMAAVQTMPLIVFGLADLSDVNAEALLQMKFKIFNSSFLPSDNSDVEEMAKACMTAQVSHSAELTTWSKTKAGKKEIAKLCTTLTTLRKNIQFLACSAVLWGYDIHLLMHTEGKHIVKKFVKSLIK